MAQAVFDDNGYDDRVDSHAPLASRSDSPMRSIQGATRATGSLMPGDSFGEGDDVGAIITKEGVLIVAMPLQYFDTTEHGQKILLRQRFTPSLPREGDRKKEWWAKGEVEALLRRSDLRARRDSRVPDAPAILPPPSSPTASASRAGWLQGLIAAILVAVIGIACLIVLGIFTPNVDPALTTEQFMALAGGIGLAIFGLTCIALLGIAKNAL